MYVIEVPPMKLLAASEIIHLNNKQIHKRTQIRTSLVIFEVLIVEI